MRNVVIDLSHHGNAEPVSFTFLDPVFAWAICAQKLSQTRELYFEYKPLVHPATGENLYGASVQNGKLMREACSRSTSPALFGLSYDSVQASKRRSYTPILVSVGNTDYSGMEACICVGYMPSIQCGDDARHELRQRCMSAIIDVIESCGVHGFKCVLDETERVLFPVLARMEFDTKEKYKFFCCARQHVCCARSDPDHVRDTLHLGRALPMHPETIHVRRC